MPRLTFLLAILCVPMIVGCEGCRRTPSPDEEAKKESPQEDFSASPAQPFPADPVTTTNAIKPGHWITASQAMRSNNEDARGDLSSTAGSRGVSLRTGDSSRSLGTVSNRRPVVLPQGQRRRFDYRLLPPLPSGGDQRRLFLSSRFTSPGQGTFFDTQPEIFRLMSAEEYFLVILTERPERFGKIKEADWVRPFRDPADQPAMHANYRVVIPQSDELLTIADTMLDWTNTAVVLWDDLPADAITPDQQTALSDWIHFGGQLIVNGAEATESVSKTRLADFLPLKPTGNIELDPAASVDLLRGCQVASDLSTEKQVALVTGQTGRVAVDGLVNDQTVTVANTGSLVLARRLGRGRIVQPRFDITSDWISDWQSYDSFVNAVLLGRPKRAYRKLSELDFVRQYYPDFAQENADASINTHLQLFARDAVIPSGIDGENGEEDTDDTSPPPSSSGLPVVHPVTGVGGWTDDSDAISLCRSILRSESGIEIPKSELVVRSLGIYLFLLVPVNYLIFRLLGRLEFAWLAVPVIAIGGALWVARAARLDIGFARSQTELALLELQPDYSRGHLTRVIAIYNSLSSIYDVEFKTIDGCGLPINDGSSSVLPPVVIETSYKEGPTLADVAVGSNQVRLLHTEQIVDIEGGLRLDKDGLLINESSLDLSDVYVIEKTDSNQTRIAVVGGCSPGSATKVRFRQSRVASVASSLPMQTYRLIRRIATPDSMLPGTARLVARVDGRLGGLTIVPESTQSTAQTVVVAHLRHQPWAEPGVDDNLLADLQPKIENTE